MKRSAFIAIVGRPNVGKSSLLNALTGEHVAIVTPKPQTTRTRITGIRTDGGDQFVFTDTPGYHTPRTALGEYMIGQVTGSLGGTDAIMFVVEADMRIGKIEHELIESFSKTKTPVILCINKIDLKDKTAILPVIAAYTAEFSFAEVVPISAKTGDGLELLMNVLSGYLKESVHFFPEDEYTDRPERFIVSEIIREKLLMCLDDEIPHGTAVEIESFKTRPDGSICDINALILSEKQSHKGIIIGKGGERLKQVLTMARTDIEKFLDIKVNLKCFVKVREDWRNKPSTLRDLGYKG